MRFADIDKTVRAGGTFCDHQFEISGGCTKFTLSFEPAIQEYKVFSVNLNNNPDDDWTGFYKDLDEAILSMITGGALFNKEGKRL